MTGLMIASRRGNLEAARAFLDCGANPEIEADNRTAARWAEIEGTLEIVRMLRLHASG